MYNCVYCRKLKLRHRYPLADIWEDFTLGGGLPCINESSVLLFSGRDEFETGPLPKSTEFFDRF